MGGLCTSNVQVLPDPKEVLKDTEIPEWISAGGQKLFQQAAGLSQSEFPLFRGPRIATFQDIEDPSQISKLTGREQRGLGILADETDIYQPYLQAATAYAGDIGEQRLAPDAFGPPATFEAETFEGTPFGEEEAGRFSNIYEQAIQPALRDVDETYGQRRVDLGAAAGKTGAFGDRFGIESAELTRGQARERGRLQKEAGQAGLEFGAAQTERDRAEAARAFGLRTGAQERAFGLTQGGRERAFGLQTGAQERAFDLNQASRNMALQAAERLAPAAQGLVQQEAQGLIAAGEAERKLDQQALDLAYRDYTEQREYPFTALNFALGALKGLPFETREFTMQRGGEFVQTPSVYGQTMGGLGALASAYKLLA